MGKSNLIYSLKWNFELEQPFAKINDIKTLSRGESFFRADFEIAMPQNRLVRLDHFVKGWMKNRLIEAFTYHYEDNLLQKRDCVNLRTSSKWYNEYIYNDLKELDRINVYISHSGSNDFLPSSYSLFYYDSQKRKTLRKILKADGELSSYEVFHYENDKLNKMEMFDCENDKLFTEVYRHSENGEIQQIDYFDRDGNYERSLSTEL